MHAYEILLHVCINKSDRLYDYMRYIRQDCHIEKIYVCALTGKEKGKEKK